MTKTETVLEIPPTREKSDWWRTVLGEYPTGVAAVTSRDADGADVGLVVGTFMAVSESPRLIGFMTQTNSRRAALIKEQGTFCANVLGYGHEELSRGIASGDPAAMARGRWQRTPLGNVRLADAIAWFEGRIVQVVPAGDHEIIIAEAGELGVGDGDSGLPLLFLRGGYGSFTVPNRDFSVPAFASRMRVAGTIGQVVGELAEVTGTECLLTTAVNDSVIVLSQAGALPGRPADGIVGMVFPFAAPIATVFAAWGSDERRKVWHEHARHLLGRVDRPLLQRLLESVRLRGYAISTGDTMAERFDRIADDPDSTRAELAELWAGVVRDIEGALEPEARCVDVSSLQFPVFNAIGEVEFELVVSGVSPDSQSADFARVVERAREAADRLTELVGERFPRVARGGGPAR
ncbi:flavin reductase [Leucobacter iarius]|uniref:IclR-ED domain-containing protein n=1 Tax=Leucobacter iarius TaxID=333963 RepID=A0ABP4XKV7_9MICO